MDEGQLCADVGFPSFRFVFLADGTSFDVFRNVFSKGLPRGMPRNCIEHFVTSEMSGNRSFMVSFEDVDAVFRRNVDGGKEMIR